MPDKRRKPKRRTAEEMEMDRLERRNRYLLRTDHHQAPAGAGGRRIIKKHIGEDGNDGDGE